MPEHDELVQRLQRLGAAPIGSATDAACRAQIARAADRSRRAWTRRFKLSIGLLAGVLTGTSGLAAAGALPAPVQRVAHAALEAVGIDVPAAGSSDEVQTWCEPELDRSCSSTEGTRPTDRSDAEAPDDTDRGDPMPTSRPTDDGADGVDAEAGDEQDPTTPQRPEGRPPTPPSGTGPATPADPGAPGTPATPATPATPRPDTPGQGTPGTPPSNPGQGTPATPPSNPGQGNPGQGNPGQGNPGQGNPGQGTPATPRTPGGRPSEVAP